VPERVDSIRKLSPIDLLYCPGEEEPASPDPYFVESLRSQLVGDPIGTKIGQVLSDQEFQGKCCLARSIGSSHDDYATVSHAPILGQFSNQLEHSGSSFRHITNDRHHQRVDLARPWPGRAVRGSARAS